jgi:hypothetical protein
MEKEDLRKKTLAELVRTGRGGGDTDLVAELLGLNETDETRRNTMKKERIYFSSWGGPTIIHRIPKYAVGDSDKALHYICSCIERATGLEVGNYQSQGTRLERGKPAGHHYQIILGHKNPRGGFDIEEEIWIEIPV